MTIDTPVDRYANQYHLLSSLSLPIVIMFSDLDATTSHWRDAAAESSDETTRSESLSSCRMNRETSDLHWKRLSNESFGESAELIYLHDVFIIECLLKVC